MKSMGLTFFLSLFWTGLIIILGLFSGWISLSTPPDWLMHPIVFVYRHLRLSVVPFGCLFVLYISLISRVRSLVNTESTDLPRLAFYDRLLNTTISSFFGVGVIWTAVGMESALVQALQGFEQGAANASTGAWVLLDRLVSGGLLLALSTTIFGGACGYTLRLLKIVFVGQRFDQAVLKETASHA